MKMNNVSLESWYFTAKHSLCQIWKEMRTCCQQEKTEEDLDKEDLNTQTT